jgi:hypothetical protein
LINISNKTFSFFLSSSAKSSCWSQCYKQFTAVAFTDGSK